MSIHVAYLVPLDLIAFGFRRNGEKSNNERIKTKSSSSFGNNPHANPVAYASNLSLTSKNNAHQTANVNLFNTNVANYQVAKVEDANVSVPHIADFYPEDNSTVPADNPCTSTLFLPKASNPISTLHNADIATII